MSRYRIIEDTSREGLLRFTPQKKIWGIWWDLTLWGCTTDTYAKGCIRERLDKEAAAKRANSCFRGVGLV